eukprot:7562207-Pyramimonas_sp.AAC.1
MAACERRVLVRELTRCWAYHIKLADELDYCGDEEVMTAKVKKSFLVRYRDLLTETRQIAKSVDKTVAQEALVGVATRNEAAWHLAAGKKQWSIFTARQLRAMLRHVSQAVIKTPRDENLVTS